MQKTIRHQVIFNLRWAPDSPQAKTFLADGQRILSAIPGVENFRVYHQVSPKNDYSFGFSMDFASGEAYRAYNSHADHEAFVKNRWRTEVAGFLEIDFEEA